MQPEAAVAIEGVVKRFAGVAAVDGIDLAIAQGEFLTLLGPSGCGKTTTLNMIAGFVHPDAGSIRLRGRPVENLPPFRRDTGMVFQDYALFPHMSVADNVAFGLRMRRLDKAEIARRVEEALDLVHLAGRGDRRPSELSGGQRQRVALARALIIRPAVLLLDEPLSNLDLKLREEMRLEITALQRRLGLTTLLVTHDQGEALAVSDRIAVMNHGRIEQVGTAAEIYEHPATRFVAAFIGSMNFLPGRVEAAAGAGELCPVAVGADRFGARAPQPVGRDEAVLVAFRPERASVASLGSSAAEGLALPGRVRQHVYLGTRIELFVDLDGGHSCIVEAVNDGLQQAPAPGTAVVVRAAARDCTVFPVE